MMMPPVATGAVDRDDDSVGISNNGTGQVLSARSRARESKQTNGGGPQDFKKAYLKVSLRPYFQFIDLSLACGRYGDEGSQR